jgi:hypothetical protein
LQARINDILASIDQRGDFDAGSKKLDTFVIIHEKAAGLFALLKDSAQKMILKETAKKSSDDPKNKGLDSTSRQSQAIARNAVESLKGFLTSQELSLSNTHRQGYINLELRLLHHECCSSLDKAGCTLNKPPPPRRQDTTLAEKGILEEYRAPILPLDKPSLSRAGLQALLSGPLKQSVLRQPLVHAADSLARARLMFGSGKKKGGETTARVVCSIYQQMCSFYGGKSGVIFAQRVGFVFWLTLCFLDAVWLNVLENHKRVFCSQSWKSCATVASPILPCNRLSFPSTKISQLMIWVWSRPFG